MLKPTSPPSLRPHIYLLVTPIVWGGEYHKPLIYSNKHGHVLVFPTSGPYFHLSVFIKQTEPSIMIDFWKKSLNPQGTHWLIVLFFKTNHLADIQEYL